MILERGEIVSSVTHRIKEIQQPRGGFLPIRNFERIVYDDGFYPIPCENIPMSLVGTVVDYLTRYMLTKDVGLSFQYAIEGAEKACKSFTAKELCSKIKGLDSVSIRAACQLASFDIFYRNPINALQYSYTEPDDRTISHIEILVKRSEKIFSNDGFLHFAGITFSKGYSEVVSSGDADYLTENTLWDMKVSWSSTPTSKDTFQLLVYYVLGCHSVHKNLFEKISYIAIYNPRLNIVFRYPIHSISPELIRFVEEKVICYNKTAKEAFIDMRNSQLSKLENQEWFTSREVCELLSQPIEFVRWMARRKYITVKRKGSGYLYSAKELQKWCDENKKCISFDTWHRIGTELYGPDQNDWKFKCPACGMISEVRSYPKHGEGLPGVINAAHKCLTYYEYDFDLCHYHYLYNEITDTELACGGIVIIDNAGKKHHAFEFADECDYTDFK